MRRALLAAVVLLGCDRRPERAVPVAIVQKMLRSEPMLFHPELPIVGQLAGTRCDVWDLPSSLYRGTVAAEVCRSWARPRVELPPEVVAAVPEERIDEEARADHPDTGSLIGARSFDGRWLATARLRGREARIWEAASRKLERVVAIASDDRGRIDDLMWTRAGALVLAADGDGPRLWSPAEPERHPQLVGNRAADETQRSFVDPAGRYLGVTGRGYRKPFSLGFASVMTFVEGRSKVLLTSERLDNGPTIRAAIFAPSRPAAFVREDKPSGGLDLCGRDETTVVAVDPERGLARLNLEDTRSLSLLMPAPDGRRALVGTEDGPPAAPCEGAEAAVLPDDRGPLLRLWDPAAGPPRVLFRAAVAAVAWAANGERFAVVTGGRVNLLDASSFSTVASWEGHEPVVVSEDGRWVGFDDKSGFALHPVDAAEPPIRLDVPAVAVAVAPGDRIALATESAVEIWNLHPPRRFRSTAITHVGGLAWSPSGEALLLTTTFHRVLLQRLDQAAPQEIDGLSTASVLGWMHSEDLLLARSPDAVRSFGWRSGEWREVHAQPLDKNFFVDPTGRYAVAASHETLMSEAHILCRLSDRDSLYLEDRGDGRIFSDGGAFSIAPPEGLAFRLGSSVLESPIVRAAEATFALPTPDLGKRFSRGERTSAHRSGEE